MSFFKDFKADFTQAMNELMPDSNEVYDEDFVDDIVEEEPVADRKETKPVADRKETKQKAKNKIGFKKKNKPESSKQKEDLFQDVLDEIDQIQNETSENTLQQDHTAAQEFDIAPEDMSLQIDAMLDNELYGDDLYEAGMIQDDVDVNTLDMSVEELLQSLDVQDSEMIDASHEENTFEPDDIAGPVFESKENIRETDDFVAEMNENNIGELTSASQEFPDDDALDVLEEVSVEDVPIEESVMEEVPVEESVMEEVPVEESVMDEVSVDESVMDEVSVDEISDFDEVTEEEVPDLNEVAVEEITDLQEISENKPSDLDNVNVEDFSDLNEITENDTSDLQEVIEEAESPLTEANEDAMKDIEVEFYEVEQTEEETTNSMLNTEEENMKEEKDVISIKSVEEDTEKTVREEKKYNVDEASPDTTYITKGTKIMGSIETDASIDIIGTVEGDVNCKGKVVVGGAVKGAITAGELYCNSARIEGDIKSYGSVKVGVGSMIIGNVEGESAVIAGAINGDIDVKGPVIVDSTAVIMGNIKSRSVQINNGAVIEGFCSQSYSDIDVKSFFA
ncbi:MAG: polymer-forming cytoskeletal protein [Lachnospiraceae bacterium]